MGAKLSRQVARSRDQLELLTALACSSAAPRAGPSSPRSTRCAVGPPTRPRLVQQMVADQFRKDQADDRGEKQPDRDNADA